MLINNLINDVEILPNYRTQGKSCVFGLYTSFLNRTQSQSIARPWRTNFCLTSRQQRTLRSFVDGCSGSPFSFFHTQIRWMKCFLGLISCGTRDHLHTKVFFHLVEVTSTLCFSCYYKSKCVLWKGSFPECLASFVHLFPRWSHL